MDQRAYDKNRGPREMYQEHCQTVYRVAFTYMKNSYDAEDAVQETFARLIRSGERFRSREKEKAWLIVTVSNVCKDMLRRHYRSDRALEDYRYLAAPPHEVDETMEAFSEWRSYKEEKLDAYYREKLPNLGSFLLGEQDADFSGFDVEDNGDGTYTFTKSYLEKDTEGGTEIDINGNHVPAYKEVLDPTTSVTVDQAEKEAFDEEMLRMAKLGGYGDYHHIYGVADAQEAEKLEELAAEYGLILRSGKDTKYAGDDSDEGLNRSLGQAVGSGDIYRQAPEFDHYSTFQSGSFQSAANIPLGDGRRLSTYLCSTAYNEMVDGREVGGFTVREDEPMSTRSYTAADGTELTISQNGSQAIVYAYLDKSYITMTMEINSCRSPGVQETDFSLDEETANYAADFINYKNIGK